MFIFKLDKLQGDIVEILDLCYSQVVSYEYDSWGNILSIKDSQGNEITDTTHIGLINPFRYRGYYYDNETKWYYLNSRYYNPEWGRFLNMDSYAGEIGGNILSHNPYIYVLNNPIVNFDTPGTFALSLIAGTGVLIGMVAGYYALKEVTKTMAAIGVGVLSNPANSLPTLTSRPKKATEAKTKDDVKTQVKPILPQTPIDEQSKPCTTAEIRFKDVVRGERLTILESISYVESGRDVMCDTQLSAEGVAMAFSTHYGPEGPHQNMPGYYPHYHPWNGPNHPHIWFYPTS